MCNNHAKQSAKILAETIDTDADPKWRSMTLKILMNCDEKVIKTKQKLLKQIKIDHYIYLLETENKDTEYTNMMLFIIKDRFIKELSYKRSAHHLNIISLIPTLLDKSAWNGATYNKEIIDAIELFNSRK